MNHPEYQYIEVALNGAHNRNHVGSIKALKNYTRYKECYATYFRYNEEMIDHFKEKNSVGGFKGSAYADWLPIDIDAENLEEAQDSLNRLFENLDYMEVDTNICRVYFSGSKGFHVMIPSLLFNASPSPDIHKRFRKVAISIAKGINIDTSIYDKTRIFRLPNTINAKSGLYKIELYPLQAMTTSINEIRNLAKQPVDRLEVETDFDVNEELAEIYHAPLESSLKPSGSVEGVKSKLCMKSLMEGVGQGNRDNVGVRVATHLKQSGLTKKMIWVALSEWNDSNDPPLETYELERIFEQGLQQYEFGCHDHILKQHCSKECIFYKEEWGRF